MIILTIVLTIWTCIILYLWREVRQLRDYVCFLKASLDISDSAINLLLSEIFTDEKERKEKIKQALES